MKILTLFILRPAFLLKTVKSCAMCFHHHLQNVGENFFCFEVTQRFVTNRFLVLAFHAQSFARPTKILPRFTYYSFFIITCLACFN